MLESFPVRNEDTIVRDDLKSPLVFNPSTGNIYQINDVGWEILQLCDGEHTTRVIINALEREYDVPRQVLEADLLSFLENMERRGCVSIKEA